jgi:hypothetical protein
VGTGAQYDCPVVPDEHEPIYQAPLSALPSVGARVAAFAAILIAGACGAMIGYAVVGLQSGSDVAHGLGALFGGVIAAAGVGVIATLVLRAMGEWKTIQSPDREPPPRR